MKLLQLFALPALLASSAKVRRSLKLRVEKANPCPDNLENRYPSDLPASYTMLKDESDSRAINALDAIWDSDKLRAALEQDSEWKVGMPWFLKATFSSDSTVNRTFGFAGGDEDGSFLTIKVPAGAQNMTIEVDDVVDASAAHAEFQYRAPDLWTSGKITMTDICLAPQSCDNFGECPVDMKKKGTGIYGQSLQRCCEYRMCKDEVDCMPATKYDKWPGFDEKRGWDSASCCKPKSCPKNLCENETKWQDNVDEDEIGSTPEECCEAKECALHACANNVEWKNKSRYLPDGSARLGSTDEECCDPIYCTVFKCEPEDEYGLRADAAQIIGTNRTICCDVKKCMDFSCPNNTQWAPNPYATVGDTKEQCCKKLFCETWECSDNVTMQKRAQAQERQGQSDEECCEKKLCSTYKCSDDTQWVHLSNQTADANLDRRGYSDEECCDKRFCLSEACEPLSQWSPKPDITSIQGSTTEQCCDKIYCNNFTCDTDADGDGYGTQWYKKKDTNTYKWQGSKNEECCVPIYCSQYMTSHPTRWRRNHSAVRGSTERECYIPNLCSDYCCDDGMELRPNAEHHQGSTDDECCIPKEGDSS